MSRSRQLTRGATAAALAAVTLAAPRRRRRRGLGGARDGDRHHLLDAPRRDHVVLERQPELRLGAGARRRHGDRRLLVRSRPDRLDGPRHDQRPQLPHLSAASALRGRLAAGRGAHRRRQRRRQARPRGGELQLQHPERPARPRRRHARSQGALRDGPTARGRWPSATWTATARSTSSPATTATAPRASSSATATAPSGPRPTTRRAAAPTPSACAWATSTATATSTSSRRTPARTT